MKINKYEYDDNQKLTNEGNKIIKGLSISALSLIILLNSCSIYNSLVNNNSEKNLEKDSKKITSSSVVASVASNPNYEINYSYVEEFYNNLLEYKTRYGNDFASSINTLDDAKSLYNFIIKFDDMYAYFNGTTNITSIEEYENILNSFYNSCIKYDVKPFLSIMFKDKGYYYQLLSEAEGLVYNLKNSLNNDYSIANQYFAWLGTNLWYGKTSVITNKISAPYIYLLMVQYTDYKKCGNMSLAIKYGKNNVLDINGRYDFTCPAGVDQFIRGYKVYDDNGNLIDKNEFHEVLIDLINNQCQIYQQNELKRSR